MKLKQLIKNLPVVIKGSKEITITGITDDSKQAAPGYLFIAKKGMTHDGTQFISDALKAGSVAIVTDCYDPSHCCTQVICCDVLEIEEVLANRFYDSPTEKLFLIGITGTNGKTTTAYLVKHLLDRCGLIGTVEWIIGDTILPATHTTPDLITSTKLLHDMTSCKCHSAVMEVSSHALAQGRVRSIPFNVAVFTNLTLDHLDYHGTMENYAAAKARLFTELPQAGWVVFNRDDPWHSHMICDCQAQRLSYGFSDRADLCASQISLTSQGMEFTVKYQHRTLKVSSPLIGKFNVYNLLAAIGVGLCRYIPLERIVETLSSFKKVPGRLERVVNDRGLNIFIDYAHTPDALKNVLETLHELKSGRIITVFGCGGNRDVAKRPKMALIAEALSDSVIVTTDNPRQEDPEEIIRQIAIGFTQKDRFKVVADRKEAIKEAVSMATKEDIVLIAGKGHETYQIFSHQTIFFDDRKVAQQAAI